MTGTVRPRFSRLSEAWRDSAACAQTVAGDEWFPPSRGVMNPLVLEICANCLVWQDCLLYALACPEIRHGIWAGLTPREVTALRDQLLSGTPGAEVVEQARWIVEHRRPRPRYQLEDWDAAPSHTQLREQGEWVRAILRAAGLLDDWNQTRDAAA